MCEAFASLFKEADARICKCYSRQMPLEQCDAQLLFEGAHPPANRGMPHAERACSRPEAQMFCDGECLIEIGSMADGSGGLDDGLRRDMSVLFLSTPQIPGSRRARSCGC